MVWSVNRGTFPQRFATWVSGSHYQFSNWLFVQWHPGNSKRVGSEYSFVGDNIVNFTTPATLIAGTNNLTVTISNVNGAGQDAEPLDDTGTRPVTISAVPAANKIVVGEEGTGTWCQWCPRGAVFMDYMHDSYAGFWAGIAVHNGNNEPMKLAEYDTPFSGFLSGYPGVLVERGTEIDPLDIEQDFLTKVQAAPTAELVNGATWDANSRTLNVGHLHLHRNCQRILACCLGFSTEDSVSGTTSGYSQAKRLCQQSGMDGWF